MQDTVIDVPRELALKGRAWPFEEARKLLARLGNKTPDKGYVLFETGYGPSGLPHIGTFGEVVRTTMVRNAFRTMSDVKTRLFAFSDDMDGLRKVPDNIPNPELIRPHLGKPLTAVPDPFGTHESFGHHNNARLRAFLDSFGFEYEFQSATAMYKSGRFDQTLLKVLEHYDAVTNVVLPTLGPERRATYSPFLPVCARTGKVLQVPLVARDVKAGTVSYRDEETGQIVEVPVTGGRCKLQWKADWGMRWVALNVDYEMSGKDLIDSVKLSSQICRVLGGRPPEGFTYELFLDEKGEKISKSKGNGLTVDEWLHLRAARKPGVVHVQLAEKRQAPAFRRDPAPGRRLPDLPEQVPGAGAQGRRQRADAAARQPGVAHPCRQAAGAGARRPAVQHPAQPRRRGEHRGQGDPVGLHLALCAQGEPCAQPVPRPAGRATRSTISATM